MAEISTLESHHRTLIYRTYGPPNVTYTALQESEFSAKQKFAPTFFDVAGVTDKIVNDFDLKQFLIYLINGQVKEYTHMVKIYRKAQDVEQMRKQRKVNSQRAWSLICVVSVADAFPVKLLLHVCEALKELQEHPRDGKSHVLHIIYVRSAITI